MNLGPEVDPDDEEWYREKLHKATATPEYGDEVWEIRALHNSLNLELSSTSSGDEYLLCLHRETIRWHASGGDLTNSDCPLSRVERVFRSMLERTHKFRQAIAGWDVIGLSLIEAITLAARLRSFLDCIKEIATDVALGDVHPHGEQRMLSYQKAEVQRWINHIV
ncbi:hypothetical protein V5O48_008618 [Marasmius crinis-equi]|uniref:Uncharacterized protein n=1 Tax=Marasmius crinis-equi TaxID=585013 RepID=A0ABR3FDD6_9AGAR